MSEVVATCAKCGAPALTEAWGVVACRACTIRVCVERFGVSEHDATLLVDGVKATDTLRRLWNRLKG